MRAIGRRTFHREPHAQTSVSPQWRFLRSAATGSDFCSKTSDRGRDISIVRRTKSETSVADRAGVQRTSVIDNFERVLDSKKLSG